MLDPPAVVVGPARVAARQVQPALDALQLQVEMAVPDATVRPALGLENAPPRVIVQFRLPLYSRPTLC